MFLGHGAAGPSEGGSLESVDPPPLNLRTLLAELLNFHLLKKDLTLQHREQEIFSFIQ